MLNYAPAWLVVGLAILAREDDGPATRDGGRTHQRQGAPAAP